jgi:hypothetical protein
MIESVCFIKNYMMSSRTLSGLLLGSYNGI